MIDCSDNLSNGPSLGRRRMGVIVVVSLLFGCFASASDLVLPLWATKTLGLSEGDWASLRSLRFAGVTIGIILLGGLSDRLGQRIVGTISLLVSGLICLVFTLQNRAALYVLMPVFGLAFSTILVSLNILTQTVTDRRQGLANSIYRSAQILAGMIAPIAAMQAAAHFGGYFWVFTGMCVMCVAGGLWLLTFPGDKPIFPYMGWRQEFTNLVRTYRIGIRQRGLLVYLNITVIWSCLLAGISSFAAIRLTQQLGVSEGRMGFVTSLTAAATLAATIASAFFVDHVSLRSLHVVVGIASGLLAACMGLTDSASTSCTLFVAQTAVMYVVAGPQAMWINRAAKRGTRASAFNVQKILAALYVTLTMYLLSLLEGPLGIKGIWLYGGLLAVGVSLLFLLLPEPARPYHKPKQAPAVSIEPLDAPIDEASELAARGPK